MGLGRRGSTVRWTLLGLALAGAAPLWAQGSDPCQPPSGDTGFAEVEANIYAGTFNRVLPFDVPLRICTPVPSGTKGMAVRLASGTAPLVVDERSCALPGAASPWSGTYEGRVDTQSASEPTARVVVPRLEAQRFYAFCFLLHRPVTAEEATALRPQVEDILRRELASFSSGDVTAADLEAHRAAVVGALAERLLAVTKAEAVESGLDELYRTSLAPQLRARLIQTGAFANAPGPPPATLANLQDGLSQALGAIRGSAPLARLLALLASEAQSNSVLADLLSRVYGDATAVVQWNDSEAQAAATGQAPDAPAGSPTLASTTDAAAAAAAASRLNATNQALADLESLIQKMTGPTGPPAVAAGLSADDKAALAALVAPGGAVARASDLSFALAGQADNLARNLAASEKAVADLAAGLELALQSVFVADGSTTGNFDTMANVYISADAGLLWGPEIDEVVPYVGTNIYTTPVNKDAPLRTLGTFRQTFRKRFAFTVGLTASSIADNGGTASGATRDDLFGNQSLLLGAGLRITDMVRVGVGGLIFKQKDPNPLIDDETTGRTYYLTFSFDLDVASAFKGGLGAVLVPGGAR